MCVYNGSCILHKIKCNIFTGVQDEVFSLKFGAEICEVALSLLMKYQTESL